MKRIINVLQIATMVVLSGSQLHAQQTWNWEAYEVSVDLPDDFKVIHNTDNEFEAEGDGMSLFMYIFEENITLDEMKDATISIANEMRLEEWDVVEDIETRAFEGKYIAGYLEGSAVLLCGVINPRNETNFIVVITFDDSDEVAEDDALKILQSLRTR